MSSVFSGLLLATIAGCGDNNDGAPDAALTPDSVPADCVRATADDSLPAPPNSSPRWAFRPWISKDISSDADTREFVQGFADRQIPVGAVVLDSPWETHYNTFEPNPSRYPNFADLVDDLHAQDIRVVLWMTQMVNQVSYDAESGGDTYLGASPNHAEALRCNYLVQNGKDDYLWWKGTGGGVDFFNADARGWWHRQQDALYDLGIDGWKLDFGDQYVNDPVLATAAGQVPHQMYSERYYEDFYTYGRHRRGEEFVTMVRPYDRSYGFEGRFYARPEHAPVAWVGDNRRDWIGQIDALDHIFRSAAAGYAMVGSDLGGYLDFDDENVLGGTLPFDTLLFARWTAQSALTPFMQLHGRANITPWTVPDNVDVTVDLYRYWANLHDQLVPLLYSATAAANTGGPMPIQPIGALADWTGDYRYVLADSFLVAPILDATGIRQVALPAGAWFDWWSTTATPIDGDQTITADVSGDRLRYPLWVRAGAIVPMALRSAVTGFGGPSDQTAMTWAMWPGAAGSFTSRDVDGGTTTVTQTLDGGQVTVSRRHQPTLLALARATAPADVELDGQGMTERGSLAGLDAAADGWFYHPATDRLWIKLPVSAAASTVVVQAP